MSSPTTAPPVTLDPRFRAGRTLVQSGKAGEGAIDIFETLVQECCREFGETNIQSAACYFEYGNALFRAAARQAESSQDDEEEEDAKPAAKDSVEEEKKTPDPESKTNEEAENQEGEEEVDGDDQGDNDENEEDDVALAFEMMETSWSLLDKYVQEDGPSDGQDSYIAWATNQLPRVLLGIGDVLSFMSRHADAADAYSRAIPYREKAIEKASDLELLTERRRLVEANVLVAEALLACPKKEDVVTTETGDLLVSAAERVDFARGYYDKAREELQETVFLMGKLAAAGKDLGTEKEDVCFISTMLMGVGTTLAEIDEEESKPPAKKLKT